MTKKDKVIFVLISILILVIGFCGYYFSSKYKDEEKRKNSLRIESIEIKLDSLSTRLNTLTSEVDSLEDQVIDMKSIDSISQNNIESLEESLNSLRKDFVILRDVRIFNYHD